MLRLEYSGLNSLFTVIVCSRLRERFGFVNPNLCHDLLLQHPFKPCFNQLFIAILEITGDEDQGQPSSWYVLSVLGFYSVCPGTDQYVMGSPVFEKATITLEGGKQFVIEAKINSKDHVYIQSAKLNGQKYTQSYIRYPD